MKYTTQEIIEILKADYLQRIHLHGAFKSLEINEKIPLFDWIDSCDFLPWEELYLYFNNWFKIEISWEEWKTTVYPEDSKTIGDVAQLLAKYAEKPDIQPIKLFGRNCQEAAIFRYLQKEIATSGGNMTGVMPSTKMGEWLKENAWCLFQEVSLIAPRALPPMDYQRAKIYTWGERIVNTAFLTMILTVITKSKYILGVNCILLLVGIITIHIGARMKPLYVGFDGINDFRDLVNVVVKNRLA